MASAQETYLGVRLGYVHSNLRGNFDSDSINPLQSFAAGFVISNRFRSSPFGVSLEPGYLIKGAKGSSDTFDYRFHYISLPVFIDYYPNDKIKLSAGLEPAQLLSSMNKTNSESLEHMYDHGIETSVTIGGAFSVAYFLDLGLRYSYSFSKATREDPVINGTDLYSQYFQLYTCWKILN